LLNSESQVSSHISLALRNKEEVEGDEDDEMMKMIDIIDTLTSFILILSV
jgi:hypothetical protein